MGPQHSPGPAGTRIGRRLAAGVVLGVLVLLSPLVVALWPGGPFDSGSTGAQDSPRSYPRAVLGQVEWANCATVTEEVACGRAPATLVEDGASVDVLLYRDAYLAGVGSGDTVLLYATQGPDGSTVHVVYGPQRAGLLITFAVVALALVAVLIGGRGLRAMASLAASGIFVWFFLVGGVAAGGHPLLYTAVTALLVLTAVLFFTHGLSEKTLAAWVGTVTGVEAAVLVGWAMSWALGLGPADESVVLLSRALPGLDLSALALAALVLVLIGVLNDIAAAQASTVFSHLDEDVDWRSRWRSSIHVGRDHAASAIYTIIFSVLGAGLAGFIMSATLDVPLGVLLQSDTGATTVVQALAGIVGTVVAMPVTTWCAIYLARRLGSARQEQTASPTPPTGNTPS